MIRKALEFVFLKPVGAISVIAPLLLVICLGWTFPENRFIRGAAHFFDFFPVFFLTGIIALAFINEQFFGSRCRLINFVIG